MDKTKIIFEYGFPSRTSQNINVIFRWFEKFRSGDFALQIEPPGWPQSKVVDNQLKAVMKADPSETTLELHT